MIQYGKLFSNKTSESDKIKHIEKVTRELYTLNKIAEKIDKADNIADLPYSDDIFHIVKNILNKASRYSGRHKIVDEIINKCKYILNKVYEVNRITLLLDECGLSWLAEYIDTKKLESYTDDELKIFFAKLKCILFSQHTKFYNGRVYLYDCINISVRDRKYQVENVDDYIDIPKLINEKGIDALEDIKEFRQKATKLTLKLIEVVSRFYDKYNIGEKGFKNLPLPESVKLFTNFYDAHIDLANNEMVLWYSLSSDFILVHIDMSTLEIKKINCRYGDYCLHDLAIKFRNYYGFLYYSLDYGYWSYNSDYKYYKRRYDVMFNNKNVLITKENFEKATILQLPSRSGKYCLFRIYKITKKSVWIEPIDLRQWLKDEGIECE